MIRARRRSPTPLGDEHGFILAWLIRLALGFVLLGLVGNEVGQIVLARVRAGDAATAGAQAGAASFSGSHDFEQARSAAARAARAVEPDVRLVAFEVAQDGKVTVEAVKTARTLVVQRVSALRRFGVQRASASSSAPP